nr:hypothetical protein CFP56_11879 [Quercus suber]
MSTSKHWQGSRPGRDPVRTVDVHFQDSSVARQRSHPSSAYQKIRKCCSLISLAENEECMSPPENGFAGIRTHQPPVPSTLR